MTTATERLRATLDDLARREADCARRCKPTLWAYYRGMRQRLGVLFDGVPEAEIVASATRVIEEADRRCCGAMDDSDAVSLWALSIYCARIVGWRKRRSLAWLRTRQEAE